MAAIRVFAAEALGPIGRIVEHTYDTETGRFYDRRTVVDNIPLEEAGQALCFLNGHN